MADGNQGLTWVQWSYCFFVAVATILGTGILALPVKLYSTGFSPFMLTFTLTLIAQLGTVFLMVELLQRASNANKHQSYDTKMLIKSSSTQTQEEEGSAPVALEERETPSLHSLSHLYFDSVGATVFSTAAMLHFTSILISYALAWSKAFCSMVNCNSTAVIAPMVIVFSGAIILFNRQIQPLVTTMTLVKCVMLVVMIGVVGYVGSQSATTPSSSWPSVGAPFLIGTLALGGVVNVMPVLYASIPHTRKALLQFLVSVSSGVVACWVMNVLWAWFILQIVPQTGSGFCVQDSKGGNITLQCAHDHDEIATQPVVAVMKRDYHSLVWLAQLVASFILISITVSYLTLGNAMKHMLDGFAAANPPEDVIAEGGMGARFWSMLPQSFRNDIGLKAILYLSSFTLIMIVALLNPQSFLLVLEVFTSLSLNIEAGVALGFMFVIARKRAKVNNEAEIVLPLPSWIDWIWKLVVVYFLIAVYYDLVTAGLEYISKAAGAVIGVVLTLIIVGFAVRYYKMWQQAGDQLFAARMQLTNLPDGAWDSDDSGSEDELFNAIQTSSVA